MKDLGIEMAVPAVRPPWLTEADRVLGLHEAINNEDLQSFLKADKRTVGDPQKQPWCGDFVKTCIRLALPTEVIPKNPYAARNWLDLGKRCEPVEGAVAVFWREAQTGWKGHVGFLAGVSSDQKRIYVLGGNQSDRVSIAALDSSRLLRYCWPLTYPLTTDAAVAKADLAVPVSEDES